MRCPAPALVRRSLVVVFALHAAIGTTLASAQTVIVRHATPGSTLELVLDGAPAGTAVADSEGNATVVATNSVDMPRDVNVWVDTCGNAHRVVLARPGAPLVDAGACRRIQIAGLYVTQRMTSFVIDTRSTSSLLLRQGPAPEEWLRDPRPVVAEAPAEPLPPLTGLTLFGAAGLSSTMNFRTQACGGVPSCSDNTPIPYGGGVGWWFNDFVAAEARYINLGTQTAEASDDAFRFTTTREGGAIAFTGRAGVRANRLRPFGYAGMSLHRATLTTTQTLNDTTVVIDDVTQTIPGGTQVLQMRTRGWAPVYGGGLEVWLKPFAGIYGEVQWIGLKGTDDRGSGIKIDDAAVSVQVGFTIRFP
jgi:hypothetical protein